MNQFGQQDFNMDYMNVLSEQMEIAALEDEAAIMEMNQMMLTAGGAGNFDHNFINMAPHQHHEQINLKSAEMPTWHECYPRGRQPIEELAAFPPYRPIIAATPPPRTSFLPSPRGPKFSYIPEPPPSSSRLAEVESGESSAATGTLISMVSCSGRHSSESAAGYGGGAEARGNGNREVANNY